MKKEAIVYCYTFENGKRYIGITSNEKRRKKDHREANSNSAFHKAIKKYGWSSLSYEVLARCETFEVAKLLEVFFISHYGSFIKNNGYNMTFGGDGARGIIVSSETKAKLSASRTGEKNCNFKNIDYYTKKAITRANFKSKCIRAGWNFDDFEEIQADESLWITEKSKSGRVFIRNGKEYRYDESNYISKKKTYHYKPTKGGNCA